MLNHGWFHIGAGQLGRGREFWVARGWFRHARIGGIEELAAEF